MDTTTTARTANPNLTALLGTFTWLVKVAAVTLVAMFVLGGIAVALGAPTSSTAPAASAALPAPVTVTAPTPARPDASDQPAGDGPLGCWNEPNAAMPGGFELIQGPISAAPVGSVVANCPAGR